MRRRYPVLLKIASALVLIAVVAVAYATCESAGSPADLLPTLQSESPNPQEAMILADRDLAIEQLNREAFVDEDGVVVRIVDEHGKPLIGAALEVTPFSRIIRSSAFACSMDWVRTTGRSRATR